MEREVETTEFVPETYREHKLKIATNGQKYPANNSFNNNNIMKVHNGIAIYFSEKEIYKVNGGSTKRLHNYSLKLPEKIVLENVDLEAIGALQGELRKSKNKASDVKFTNSNPKLHNIVMEFYKKLGLSENEISWKISALRKNVSEIEAKKYWLENSRFKKQNFKSFRYSNGKILSKTPKFGTVEMWIKKGVKNKKFNNTLFFHVLRTLINLSLRRASKNEEISIPILKGLFAAEGFVDTKSRFCGLSSKSKLERKLYKKLLKNIGITAKEHQDAVRFTSGGFENPSNFKKLNKFNLLELSKRKEKEFHHIFNPSAEQN